MPPITKGTSIKWKSILALALIGLAVIFDQYWLWGVLFVIWAVNDLKNRRTYLLEDIQQAESPILFWVIVTMWFSLALWVLSYAPPIQDFMHTLSFGESHTVMFAEASDTSMIRRDVEVYPASSTADAFQTAKGLNRSRSVSYRDIHLNVMVPGAWKAISKEIPRGKQLDVEAPSGRGTLSCIVFDMGRAFRRDEFISLMEKELSADLPFVRKEAGKKLGMLLPEKVRGLMDVVEYSGNLDGEFLRAVVGYGVEKEYGFMLIGVYGDGDEVMEKSVYESLRRFSVNWS